jgi:hypothetical protein
MCGGPKPKGGAKKGQSIIALSRLVKTPRALLLLLLARFEAFGAVVLFVLPTCHDAVCELQWVGASPFRALLASLTHPRVVNECTEGGAKKDGGADVSKVSALIPSLCSCVVSVSVGLSDSRSSFACKRVGFGRLHLSAIRLLCVCLGSCSAAGNSTQP